jgi:hypothetical protein
LNRFHLIGSAGAVGGASRRPCSPRRRAGDCDRPARCRTLFAADIAAIGAELLDRRDELFVPARFFFDTLLHLDAAQRTIRTDRLVANPAAGGIGA